VCPAAGLGTSLIRSQAAILRRKPTRIELKPDDRDEYFAQKNKEKQPEAADSKDSKQSDKDARIGIVRPR